MLPAVLAHITASVKERENANKLISDIYEKLAVIKQIRIRTQQFGFKKNIFCQGWRRVMKEKLQ